MIAGPDSDFFHVFKEIVINGKDTDGTDEVKPVTFLDFAEWLGAFYLSCFMGKSYSKL